MKLTNTPSMKAKSGMTLLELTVVILVLLSLISILFVGARAWKKGSDRSANIMNIRNTQQAMRGHQNMKELPAGEPFVTADLEDYMKFPKPIAPGDTEAVVYEEGTEIMPHSAAVAASYAHIWIQGLGTSGAPGGTYGQNGFEDSSGW